MFNDKLMWTQATYYAFKFPCNNRDKLVFFTGSHDHAETLDSPFCLCADHLSDVHLTGSSIQVRPPALFLKVLVFIIII